MEPADISDPRAWPAAPGADAFSAGVHRMADQAMRAPTQREADAIDAAARERLDFTVIGPAVNEASRIERLCDTIGRHLVTTQAFARAADASRHELVSLGRHRLRGVREETELFGLAP